ncbi:MAG: hypothetical protein ACTSRZ_17655 [Promethearchaeota archaeon]
MIKIEINRNSIESYSIDSGEDEEQKLRELFRKETGKNPIYRGKVTKQYLEWKKRYRKQ